MFGLQTFSYGALLRVAAVGLVVGVLQIAIFKGLSLATEQSRSEIDASYVPLTLMVVSVLFAHFIGLIALIRLTVLRPLLVILAAIATLWGVWIWVENYAWWVELLAIGALFAVTYSYYAWVNRLLTFPVALAVTVISVLIARAVFISL